MRTIKITVIGQSFHIRSDANEEHLQKLAIEIEKRFRELKKGGSRGDQDFMIMSMVAVSLLDELKTAEAKYQSVNSKSRDFGTKIIDKIDELLVREIV